MKSSIWLGISALILAGNAIAARAEIDLFKNNYNQSVQIISQYPTTNSTQIETEIREFINAWGEAWSPRENAAEFTSESFAPFYLQSDELLAFDFTDAESQTVFKGVQNHHNTWEAFVSSFDYWTFTPVTESIRVYPQSAILFTQ